MGQTTILLSIGFDIDLEKIFGFKQKYEQLKKK